MFYYETCLKKIGLVHISKILPFLLTAQLEAVSALERFPTQGAKRALVDIMEDEKTFFKVRCSGNCNFMGKKPRVIFIRYPSPKYEIGF